MYIFSKWRNEKSVPNGSKLSVGGKLYFKLKTAGGIIDPIEKVRVVWEVSNGGIGTHSSHQEIYFKGQAEDNNMFTFSRDLSYYGIPSSQMQNKQRQKRHNNSDNLRLLEFKRISFSYLNIQRPRAKNASLRGLFLCRVIILYTHFLHLRNFLKRAICL